MVSITGSRRYRRLGCAIAALGALCLGVGGASATHYTSGLVGSTFEAADGNLLVDDTGKKDWNSPIQAITCVPSDNTPIVEPADGVGINCGRDITDIKNDNAFGQGAKEDTENPTEVEGSIPPNKSNLTRFYVNTEKTSGNHDLLYLAFERSNVLGTANMDFELNQNRTTPTGKITPFRTEGDLLITFDFTKGGTKPDLGYLKWRTANGKDGEAGTSDDNDASQCFANNALPCWGDRVVLGGNEAEGAVYKNESETTPDTNDPDVALPAFTFGEAGIDLQAAGVFEGCQHFGSAFLKSRSAASFPAELKDFIAPIPIDITNCGSLSVQKYIDINEDGNLDTGEAAVSPTGSVVSGDLLGWSFTITGPGGFTCSGTTTAAGLLDTCGTADLDALTPGTYTVTENANTGRKIGTKVGDPAAPVAPFLNIDPGADDVDGGTTADNAPVSETISVGVSGSASVDFGNSCYATANFEVTGVPSGQSGLFVRYTLASEGNLIEHDLDLTLKAGSTTTYIASQGGLRRSETVTWSYGINHEDVGGTEQTKAVPATFSLSGYPSCSGGATTGFASSTIQGLKYKDMNADGVKQAAEPGIQGFGFKLMSGSTQVGTTQRSSDTGVFSFTGVAPGTYTIEEITPPTGWVQTEPASDGDETVTVGLGDGTVTTDTGGNPIRFGNTPQSTIRVVFGSTAKLLNADGTESTTNATQIDPAAPITCKDKNDATLTLTGATASDKTTGQLLLSKSAVTCTVTFIDP